MKVLSVTALGILCAVSLASAQASGTAGRGATPAKRTAAPAVSMARVMIRDKGGVPLDNVKITLSGVASDESTTNGFGAAVFSNLKDGTYRLRFEREGFVTLEREITVKAPQPVTVEVQLTEAAPPPPPPPPPPPTPAPLGPAGPPVTLSIPNYLDKNLIGGRDPIKESVFSCSGLETVRLLQLRDALAEHAHADADEVLYVVAGEGAVRIGGEATAVSAGSVSIVPHGSPHAVERRGRNPLILLSTLAGTPCKSNQ
jgi:mannose-6-phosphate isomerase-like protein (cupin superfamily)